MDEELPQDQVLQDHTDLSPFMRRFLLILNIIMLAIGGCGGPQLMRLYFVHGGKRLWFSSWLASSGFPILLIPITLLYLHRVYNNAQHGSKRIIVVASHQLDTQENEKKLNTKFITMKLPLLIGSAFIGVLTGLDNYLLSYGVARLPVSTSSLILASQLAFTALFAFLLVKQKFTCYSINAIFLLVAGSVILGLNTNNDRPIGVTKHDYYVGFFVTVAAAGLYGFVLPAVEMIYKKGRQVMSYGLVLEVQMVMSICATLFSTVGMLINKDFQGIPREAREYGLGEVNYYLVVAWGAIVWQFFFLGAVGVIFCSSSLLSGVITSVLLPFTEALAIIIFNEKFQAEKGLALVMSLWGLTSYYLGEMKLAKKSKKKVQQSFHGDSNNNHDELTTNINNNVV